MNLTELWQSFTTFILSTRFLYVEIIFILILASLFNICLYLKKTGKIKEPLRPEKKSFPKTIWFNISRILFSTLGFGLLVNILFTSTILASTAGIIIPAPRVSFPIEPSLGVTELTPENPAIVKFDRPVSSKNMSFQIDPPLEGEWKFSNSIAPTSVAFYPKVSPERGVRYQISLLGIKSLVGNGDGAFLFTFQSPPIPEVESIKPLDGDQGVMPNQEIAFSLNYPAEETALIEYVIDPEIAADMTSDGKNYKIKPKDGFRKSNNYTLTLYRTLYQHDFSSKENRPIGDKEEMKKISFRIIEAPGLESYSPTGNGVLANTPIKMVFKQDMDRASTQSAFSITPSTNGNFSWENDRTIIFTPSLELVKATKYAVSVSTAAKAIDGSPIEEVMSFEFTTIGHVTASMSPGNGAKNVGISTPISIAFNQAVDHGSAESKFSISPSVPGNFSWSGNTLKFNHDNFGYSSGYSVTVAPGVKTIYGLDSAQAFSSSFTTQAQSVTLNVPSYHQSYTFSCMLSASRSALAYRGISVSESSLYNQIAKDGTGFSGCWPDNVNWGNPNAGFVGELNGQSLCVSRSTGSSRLGYGAHWNPVANMLSGYRSVEVKSGWNVQGLAAEIASGNPVIVWWVNGVWPAFTVNWNGGSVYGVNSMHVQVVKGFTGTVDNPTSFVVTDSGYGYPGRTFSVDAFKAKWGWFGNTGIVVR